MQLTGRFNGANENDLLDVQRAVVIMGLARISVTKFLPVFEGPKKNSVFTYINGSYYKF